MCPGPTAQIDAGFLAGGGEMGERMRGHDWSATSLGPATAWPTALKTTVAIMLASRQPMFVWWGPGLTTLYNDAYRALAGDRHPDALGQPASQVWHEVWDELGGRAQRALLHDAGTFDEALPLIAERHGHPEETYTALSLNPVPDGRGGTGGILGIGTDRTARVLGDRQLAVLRDLAARTGDASTAADACARSAECLEGDPRDFPFAMLYLIERDGRRGRLAAACGIARGHPAAPDVVPLGETASWPLAEALESGAPRVLGDLGRRFGRVPGGVWLQPPQQAVVVPLARAGDAEAPGVLVAGLNPFRPFDDDYRGFVDLVAAQIGDAIAGARDRNGTPAAALGETDAARRGARDSEGSACRESMMVWVSEPDGICSFLSGSWYDYTGERPGAQGAAWWDAAHPDDRAAVVQAASDAATRRDGFRLEYRMRGRDGEYRRAVCTAAPRFAADGRFLGHVGSIIDVAERREAEDALRDVDRRRDEFLATLAHELRNPLAPISYGLHVMSLANTAPESMARVREMMERQVHQMVRLIDDLLDVSRISRGMIELRQEWLDLASVALDALETSRPLIQARAHRVEVSTPAEPVFVHGDATRLAQAVSNLLNNAAKYTPRGGHICLAVERDGDGSAVVSVTDDGVGIPTPMLSQVFDLFVQVDPSLEKAQGGLGIGLTIVRRLIELHGGTVEARSAGPGAGSQFVIRLSAAAAPRQRAAGPARRWRRRARPDLAHPGRRRQPRRRARARHDAADDGARGPYRARRPPGAGDGGGGSTAHGPARPRHAGSQRLRHMPPHARAAVGQGRGDRRADRLGTRGRPPPLPRGRLRRAPRQAGGPDRAHQALRRRLIPTGPAARRWAKMAAAWPST